MRTKIFAAIIFLFAFCMNSQAQKDCDVIDCPGQCGRFIDQNGDGFCDHGGLSKPTAEPVQNADTAKPEKVAAKKKTVVKPSVSTTDIAVEKDAEKAKPQDLTVQTDTTTETEVVPATEERPAKRRESPYDLLLISGLTLVLYAFSAILVKVNVLKKATHRKIWNVVLLVTAIVSCLSGFFLVIQINYGIAMQTMRTFRYWHVQFGIPMTIVAVIHILWHINYWKSLVHRAKQKNNS